MPADATDVAVLRIVVRDGFNADLADDLVRDVRAVCAELEEQAEKAGTQTEPGATATASARTKSHFAH
jgi:glutamate decarboxylase